MSSYNNIRKIKYTKNPSDVVSLQEYIIFEDSHAKEKYVVFKFSNNLNQRLLGFKFEVLQYNKDNELLEKSVVLHEDFTAEANDLFVPNAKLKVNFECESLEVKLASASFDRVVWSDGEFQDNSYSFDSYAETVAKPARGANATDVKKKPNEKDKNKKNKLGYNIKDIFRRNKAGFPTVFNVFLCIVFVGLIVFSTFYFKNATGAFSVEDFVVQESSSGYVTILDYAGNEEDIEIPSILETEDDVYYVAKIAKGAFSNSSIKSIEIKTERSLLIETGAFSNCSNLTEVIGASFCGEIIVMEGAFKNCTALNTFIVPTAELCSKCFDGTNNIKNLEFYMLEDRGKKLLDIFNGLNSISLNHLKYYFSNVPDNFLENVSSSR